MKTLIVEDDFVSRKYLQHLVAPYGPCDVAVNGEEALDAFRLAHEEQAPYDLICLDVMMPGLDGSATLRELRHIEESMGIAGLRGARVIMATALSSHEKIMESFRDQCDGYLIKPIDPQKLRELIESFGFTRTEDRAEAS